MMLKGIPDVSDYGKLYSESDLSVIFCKSYGAEALAWSCAAGFLALQRLGYELSMRRCSQPSLACLIYPTIYPASRRRNKSLS